MCFSGVTCTAHSLTARKCLVIRYAGWVSDVIRLPIVATVEQLPSYARLGDAGADLRSAESLTLQPGERALIRTGVKFALPEGYLAFVVPRSGLAVKHGISVVNAPGTIDSGYRGEIMVPLINLDQHEPFAIAVGDRIAQLIVMPFTRVEFVLQSELPDSERGEDGFGSTGVSRAP